MKNICKVAIAIFISFILLGCEGKQSDINLVKDGTLDSYKTITIGQAFDSWKECENTKWEAFKTDNGTKVVEFNCETKSVKELASRELHKFISNESNRKKMSEKTLKSLTKLVEEHKSYIVIQFSLNTDNTFQLQYAGYKDLGKISFRDYKTGDKIIKHNIDFNSNGISRVLNAIYNNDNIIF